MKRFFIVVIVSLFIAALTSSCKTADCPAYSEVDVEQAGELLS